MEVEGTPQANGGIREEESPGPEVRRVLLDPRSGEVSVGLGAAPVLNEGSVLIQTAFSVISPGTERSKLELASSSLLGKARSRPDLVKQVVDKVKKEGLRATAAAVKRQLQEPMTLGYSLSGTALAVGHGVRDIRPGDRVAAGGGGYAIHADIVSVPQNLVVRVPDGVPLDQAAMTTLASVGLHGFRLAQTQVGETVVVIGLGLVGLLAAGLARAAGCFVVGADLDQKMIDRAADFGIPSVASKSLPDEVDRVTRGRGADAVLVCAASDSPEPTTLAGRVARDKARIVIVGGVPVEAPRELFFEKELELVVSRSYGPGRYDPSYEEHGHDYPLGFVRWTERRNMESVLDLMEAGRFDIASLVRDQYPADRAATAYEEVKSRPGSIALLDYGADRPATGRTDAAVRQGVASRKTGGSRIGLIGAGSFASRILVPALVKAGAPPVAVVSQLGRRPAWADKLDTELVASAEELVARDDIDAVAIASRHDSHAPLTIAALDAGKAVFVEKPLALTTEELAAVGDAYERSRGPLLVGFNRRHAPFARRLASAMSARSAPALLSMRVNAGSLPVDHWLRDPAVGGGRILGEMCHFIDLATYLIQSRPVRVSASSMRVPGESPQVADNVGATFEFEDGSSAVVTYAAAGDSALGKERIEAFFEGKAFVIDDWTQFIESSAGDVKKTRQTQAKGHEEEMSSFVALLNGEGSDDFEISSWSMAATFAVIESLSLGTSVDL